MAESNRTQIILAKQPAFGSAPTVTARKVRVTGESMRANRSFERSEELRADRMVDDTALVGESATGGFGSEAYYGEPTIGLYENALFSTFAAAASIENSASDTEITQVTDSTDTFTVSAGGTAFKAGHLIRTTGFTNAANNGIFKVSSSTSTTVVAAGTPSLTDEAAPPKGALIRAVGFQGTSGDITATASGLGSTTLDFTTLGLVVGQWIKTGGTATGDKFATAACNTWARVTAIAANALTLDNLPAAWTTDSGTGKTIKVWFGRVLKVGTTKQFLTIEKAVLDQTTVLYRKFTDMIVNSMDLNVEAGTRITQTFDFLGSREVTSATSFDGTAVAASDGDIMNGVSNVGRIAENGNPVASPNYARRLSLQVRNNLREQMAIGTLGLIGVGAGDCDVTATVSTYFGDNTLYAKFDGETTTNLNFRMEKATDSVKQAYVHTLPKLKIESADAPSGGRNQDVMLEISLRALKDSVTGTNYQIDAFDYYEA